MLKYTDMEETIEKLQDGIMSLVSQFGYQDASMILRELESFCGKQADEYLKMEYQLSAMEEEMDE